MNNILSVDVEDWFHILELDSTPDLNQWEHMESAVDKNFRILLDEFDRGNVKVTCFFLGWVAEHHPALVREAYRRGHEIASHGYAHRLIYTQSQREFLQDIQKSKAILEDIIGQPVNGYRAPGFSITNETPWAFDLLAEAGFQYDSSIFPAARGHGGIKGAEMRPYKIATRNGDLIEFPVTVAPILKKRMCFFGGGYLRLFPYFVIRYMSKVVNKRNRPVIFYLHPREVDPHHPRLSMGLIRRFKSYINLSSTLPKLRKLLDEQDLLTFREWLTVHSRDVLDSKCS
jgi:polysaccharide deacetylase family protein (PEP-CTERM system associated)